MTVYFAAGSMTYAELIFLNKDYNKTLTATFAQFKRYAGYLQHSLS
jgi:hypothetical protein